MEVFEIFSDNIDEFFDFIGEDLTKDLQRVYYRGIGVKSRGKPVGAMVYELFDSESEKDTQSVIHFAKTDNEETRSAIQGFYKNEAVREDGIILSSYELPNEEETEAFVAAGFSKGKKEGEEIGISLKEIAQLSIAKQKRMPRFIKSLSEISATEFRKAIKHVMLRGHKGIVEDLPYLPMSWFDPSVSSCFISDGKPEGFFLIRKTPSGLLIPMLLFAYGADYKKNLLYMIEYSAQKAVSLYTPATKIRIIRKNDAVRGIVSKLAPGAKGEEVFYGSRKEMKT